MVFAVWVVIRNFKNRRVASTEPQTNLLFLAELIIATSLVYVVGVRYWDVSVPGNMFSHGFPEGRGSELARYALITAFPIAIAFAWLIDQLSRRIGRYPLRKRRVLLSVPLYLLIIFGLVEQFARKEGFNGFSIKDENEYLEPASQGFTR